MRLSKYPHGGPKYIRMARNAARDEAFRELIHRCFIAQQLQQAAEATARRKLIIGSIWIPFLIGCIVIVGRRLGLW